MATKIGHSKNALYSERIQVKMTDREPLEFIHDRFGGSFYKSKRTYQSVSGFHSNKPLYVLILSDKRAITLIELIRPYLKVKHRQADLLLMLRESKNDPLSRKRGNRGGRRKGKGQPMDESIIKLRESLYLQCKELHKRGGDG